MFDIHDEKEQERRNYVLSFYCSFTPLDVRFGRKGEEDNECTYFPVNRVSLTQIRTHKNTISNKQLVQKG
jgi:hypothetical protein